MNVKKDHLSIPGPGAYFEEDSSETKSDKSN
jgi:hypothetical protein